jgi:hypothetical protein
LTYGQVGDWLLGRVRTLTDDRRLLFQSLADLKGEVPEFDVEDAKRFTAEKAFDVSEDIREYTCTNYDDYGDEIYNDIVDVRQICFLYIT